MNQKRAKKLRRIARSFLAENQERYKKGEEVLPLSVFTPLEEEERRKVAKELRRLFGEFDGIQNTQEWAPSLRLNLTPDGLNRLPTSSGSTIGSQGDKKMKIGSIVNVPFDGVESMNMEVMEKKNNQVRVSMWITDTSIEVSGGEGHTKSPWEEIQYLLQMLTATTENDASRIRSIGIRLSEIADMLESPDDPRHIQPT